MSVVSLCCKSFCVVPCASFCTGHFVMVPLNMTYLHCLQHSCRNLNEVIICSQYVVTLTIELLEIERVLDVDKMYIDIYWV